MLLHRNHCNVQTCAQAGIGTFKARTTTLEVRPLGRTPTHASLGTARQLPGLSRAFQELASEAVVCDHSMLSSHRVVCVRVQVRKLAAYVAERATQTALRHTYARATVTRVTPLGSGHRVCVDTVCTLKPGEGMLVGPGSRISHHKNSFDRANSL